MDFERARFNMIEQQIRPWNVLDPSVLALLRKVPREQFVTTRQQALAFADLSIPLDHDQVMMQPKVEARLIQALALTRQDRVLEIGTGSGCIAISIASGLSSAQLTATDISPAALAVASTNATTHEVADRIVFLEGDLFEPLDSQARFDFIASNPPYVTTAQLDQLAPDIRVNCVCPGFIDTDMVAAMDSRVVDGVKKAIPMRRLGRPEEVATVVRFLASDLISQAEHSPGASVLLTWHPPLIEQVREALVEQLGPIQSFELDWMGSFAAAEEDEDVLVFQVEGTKTRGELTVKSVTGPDGNEHVEWAELRLTTGEVVELVLEE